MTVIFEMIVTILKADPNVTKELLIKALDPYAESVDDPARTRAGHVCGARLFDEQSHLANHGAATLTPEP